MSEARPAEPLGLLLLEDNPADSRLLVESLRDEVAAGEVVVQTVRRLADAMRELKRMRFSCVLVDLGLPDGEGVAHVGRIREADPQVAIIVLTGLGDRRAADEAVRLGAQDYLLKGQYWGSELLQAIRRSVAARRAQLPAPAGTPSAAPVATFEPWVDATRGRFAGVRVRPVQDSAEAWSAALASIPDATPVLAPVPADADAVLALLRSGSRPLGLMVTTRLLEDAARVETLVRLRAAGAELWAEGWRAGAADLGLLTRIGLDGLVLDPSLAATLARDEDDGARRFVLATLAAAGGLSLKVLADGVSLAVQHQRLGALGCRWMMGPWFSDPGPAGDLPARWGKGPRGFERRVREVAP